jgi:hypothetical protein
MQQCSAQQPTCSRVSFALERGGADRIGIRLVHVDKTEVGLQLEATQQLGVGLRCWCSKA